MREDGSGEQTTSAAHTQHEKVRQRAEERGGADTKRDPRADAELDPVIPQRPPRDVQQSNDEAREDV